MKYAAYFLIGGSVITVVTYLGGSGRSLLSAFIATFPVVTLASAIFIHREAGTALTADFVRGLLLFAPAWLAYLATLLVCLPRMSFIGAVASSIGVFLAGVAATRMIVKLF